MIATGQPFDDQLVQTVRRMPGIADAEARGLAIFQVRVGDQEGQNAQFDIIPDFDDMRISTIRPIAGAWPPPRKALLLERTSLAFLGVAVGDDVTIELPDGTRRTMRVAGTVHDVNWASQLYNFGKAYITRDTARWLGQADGFNQLRLIVSEHADDEAHIKQVVSQVRDKIEKAGLTVDFTQIPSPPGKHWADQIMQALLLIMGVLGIVALILSGFLVINTIGAILTQQSPADRHHEVDRRRARRDRQYVSRDGVLLRRAIAGCGDAAGRAGGASVRRRLRRAAQLRHRRQRHPGLGAGAGGGGRAGRAAAGGALAGVRRRPYQRPRGDHLVWPFARCH